METARISALLAPFLDRPLAPVQLDQISTYIDLLLRWNARINLTAVRDPESIVARHFGESFFLARHAFPPASEEKLRILDIGSGGGFPGLPLRIWAHDVSLTLIESNHKKAAFLREVSRSLILTDVNVMTGRAETLPGLLPPADLVTFRAVEHFENVLPLAIRFLAPTGRLALLIGASQVSALKRLAPQLSWALPIPIPNSESRVVAMSQPST